MLFQSARPDPILTRRLGGLAASAALHALAILLPQLPARTADPGAPAAGGPEIVAVAPGAVADAPAAPAGAGGRVEPRRALEIAGIAIDLPKLVDRADRLFPFLAVAAADLVPDARSSRSGRRLRTPYGVARGGPTRPPLVIGDRALDRIVDEAWSRNARWGPFAPIARLLESHDADHGRAADLLRAYTDRNLLQPYYDGDVRDGRFWIMLGLAADHLEFLDLVGRFARQHPSSRVTTELWFLLEELAQGSRDTLLMLLSTSPDAALRQTLAEDPEAFRFAVQVRARYSGWLRERGLEAERAVRRRYDRVRLALLAAIVERSPGGYRVADARYLAGVIHFEQNDLAGAERWWRAGPHDPGGTYAAAYAGVLEAMRLPEARRAAAIAAVLGGEHRRWLDFSEGRLARFGYAVDRY